MFAKNIRYLIVLSITYLICGCSNCINTEILLVDSSNKFHKALNKQIYIKGKVITYSKGRKEFYLIPNFNNSDDSNVELLLDWNVDWNEYVYSEALLLGTLKLENGENEVTMVKENVFSLINVQEIWVKKDTSEDSDDESINDWD